MISFMCKSIIVESINPKIVISRAQQLNMLPVIAFYERPLDFPQKFVARVFYQGKATVKTKEAVIADSYEMLLAKLSPCLDYLGLVKIMPTPYDDKSLLETWI